MSKTHKVVTTHCSCVCSGLARMYISVTSEVLLWRFSLISLIRSSLKFNQVDLNCIHGRVLGMKIHRSFKCMLLCH